MHAALCSLLALAKPLIEVDPAKLQVAIPLLSPVVLAIAWWCNWHKLSPGPTSGGGKSKKGAGGSGGTADLEPPVYLMLALVVFFALGFAAVALQSLPEAALGPDKSIQRTAAIMLMLYTFGGGAVLLIGRLIAARVGAAPAGWVTIRPFDLLRGIGLVVLLMPVFSLVNIASGYAYQLFTGHAPEQIAHEQLTRILENRSDPWAIGLIAAAVLGAPLVEEFIYRGLLLRGVLGASRMPWLSVLVTSVIFAGVHVGSVGPQALPVLFAVGLACAITLVRTNRLGLAVGIHIGFNAINVLLAFWLSAS